MIQNLLPLVDPYLPDNVDENMIRNFSLILENTAESPAKIIVA